MRLYRRSYIQHIFVYFLCLFFLFVIFCSLFVHSHMPKWMLTFIICLCNHVQFKFVKLKKFNKKILIRKFTGTRPVALNQPLLTSSWAGFLRTFTDTSEKTSDLKRWPPPRPSLVVDGWSFYNRWERPVKNNPHPPNPRPSTNNTNWHTFCHSLSHSGRPLNIWTLSVLTVGVFTRLIVPRRCTDSLPSFQRGVCAFVRAPQRASPCSYSNPPLASTTNFIKTSRKLGALTSGSLRKVGEKSIRRD